MPRLTAILFDRLGSYHWARLNAAGRILPVTGIEVFGRSKLYQWEPVTGQSSFQRVTVFPDADSRSISAREVQVRLCDVLSNCKPAVIVTHGWSEPSALAALIWARKTATPAIVMSETPAIAKSRAPWREAVKRRVVALYSAALVGGKSHVDYLLSLHMPSDRIFTGYDAVDNDYFAHGASDARNSPDPLRTRLALPKNYFLSCARYVPQKNLAGLLQAYARYRALAAGSSEIGVRSLGSARSSKIEVRSLGGAELPTPNSQLLTPTSDLWHLVLLGDGPMRPALTTLRSALSLTDSVHLTGFKQYPELPAYYGLASAFILPSTSEAWGLVVNEAMAAGLPVLVSNRCGCAPDLVHDGRNGFTFDPEDIEGLAQLMYRIACAHEQRPAMAEASREIVRDFGPERFATGLRQAIEVALKQPVPEATWLDRLLLRALIRRPSV